MSHEQTRTEHEALAEYIRNFATVVEYTMGEGDDVGGMWAVALREIANKVVSLGQRS